MTKLISKFLILLCFFICFNACQDSTKNSSGTSDISEKENTKKTDEELNETETKNSTLPKAEEAKVNNYEIPVWPLKPKAEAGKLYPFDEGTKDPGFVKYRQELYNTIKEKDVTRLLSMISDKVHFSFGDSAGKDAFIKFWELDSNPNDSEIWKEMASCLELGGEFSYYGEKKRYAAPYLYSIEAFEDPFEEGVIIGHNVRIRDKPGSKAKIIGSLSWDHVKIFYENNALEEEINGEKHYWVHLKPLNGEKGYVYGKYVRTSVDYRMGFVEYEKEKWKLDFFIAGD